MTLLSHDRCCDEVVAQTDLLRPLVTDADLSAPVPSCPGWDLGRLLRHVGAVQRWAEEVVRTRADHPVEAEPFHKLAADLDADPEVLGPWLTEGAAHLANTLRAAGPDVPLWTPVPQGVPSAAFYARRFAHETAVHRADAALAVGGQYALEPEVALDALDEWLELLALPAHLPARPGLREVFGPGRTVHLAAVDVPAVVGGEWLVDLTGDTLRWRRGGGTVAGGAVAPAVSVRGALTDLLLLVYRRRPATGDGLAVTGDMRLLELWLERAGFG